MAYELPALPYAVDALAPHIDVRTMEIHHGKHHAAYVANLNKALEGHADLQAMSLEELLSDLNAVPEAIRTAVRNNGGGHYNHSMFWKLMKADGGGQPGKDLGDALVREFGSFEEFKTRLSGACATRFGSGWGWLAVRGGKLEISSSANQDSPLMDGATPILGIDVWEHAYYLNYQNRRPDYVAAWWNVVNWDQVAENFNSVS